MAHLLKSHEDLINPHIRGLGISATLAINARSKELIEQGKTVYRFGLGQSPFPVPDLVVSALKLNAIQKDYLPVRGLQQLREAVADFHRRKDEVDIQPDCVLIGPGSKELVFLLQLVFNGEIIVVSPGWVSYVPQAKILNNELSFIHSTFEDKWQLTPKLFSDFLKKRKHPGKPALMILNYPGNPDGVSLTRESLVEIAALARAHHIFILSDEIYGQLDHKGKHISLARLYPEGTIISSGLSKWCGAGGWRLGTFAFPKNMKWLLNSIAIVASETYTSVSAPIQYAAVQAFNGGIEIEEYLWQARKILAGLGNECVHIFRAAGVKVHDPVGGFYLFLDFSNFSQRLHERGINNSSQLCLQLLDDTGVALLQGSSFYRSEEELTARMAYVDFAGPRALAAARTIPLHEHLPDDFIKTYCHKVIKGVKEMVQWLTKQ